MCVTRTFIQFSDAIQQFKSAKPASIFSDTSSVSELLPFYLYHKHDIFLTWDLGLLLNLSDLITIGCQTNLCLRRKFIRKAEELQDRWTLGCKECHLLDEIQSNIFQIHASAPQAEQAVFVVFVVVLMWLFLMRSPVSGFLLKS